MDWHIHLIAFVAKIPRKVKSIWSKRASGSGISCAICKSAPHSRQITTPAPHHSVFLQAGCPSCHPTNSVKHWRQVENNVMSHKSFHSRGLAAEKLLLPSLCRCLRHWGRNSTGLWRFAGERWSGQMAVCGVESAGRGRWLCVCGRVCWSGHMAMCGVEYAGRGRWPRVGSSTLVSWLFQNCRRVTLRLIVAQCWKTAKWTGNTARHYSPTFMPRPPGELRQMEQACCRYGLSDRPAYNSVCITLQCYLDFRILTVCNHWRWRCGIVVSGVRRMNKVNARWARLVPGWVTVFGWVYHLSM